MVTNILLFFSGLSYYIPQTEGEFKASLRSGRYNTYLLIDFNREDLKDELKEAIHYGDGLVYIKTVPNNIPVLQELFGVQFSGMSTYQNLTVNLTESPISGPATLQTIDKDIKTTITSEAAQGLGYVVDKNLTYPVIVYNHYGRGRVLLFSFDLLNSPEQGKVKDLIVNALRYVAPAEPKTRAFGSERIRITMQNSTEPAEVKATETMPANITVDAIDQPAAAIGNTITYQTSLAGNQIRTLGYRLRLPDLSGEYQLATELSYSNHNEYRLYGNYSLAISVFGGSTELLSQAIVELQALPVTGDEATHASGALSALWQVTDRQGITKTEAQANIGNILNAIRELERVAVDVSAIRLKLDELLKIWQTKWSLAPGAVSNAGRYRLVYETDARKLGQHAVMSSCSSFPQAKRVGNLSERCNEPILLASTGSAAQLFNSSTTSEVLYFYHTDHLGTPILMTDQNQNVVWQGEFLPFGEPFSIAGAVTNNLRFPGQYYDEETGLHQNWHRDYKPTVGRYLQPDPIGFLGGFNLYLYVDSVGKPPTETNLYLYTDNNPVNRIDPLGLFWNGNAGAGYWWQDMECSPPAQRFNDNPCTKKCCVEHDLCYQRWGCNSSSWYGHFPGLPIPSICQLCNYKAAACILMNKGKTDCGCK